MGGECARASSGGFGDKSSDEGGNLRKGRLLFHSERMPTGLPATGLPAGKVRWKAHVEPDTGAAVGRTSRFVEANRAWSRCRAAWSLFPSSRLWEK